MDDDNIHSWSNSESSRVFNLKRYYHYFPSDDKCIIDLVLVSQDFNSPLCKEKDELRQRFLRKLQKSGFRIDYKKSSDGLLSYALLHVTANLMNDQAEALHFKVPIRRVRSEVEKVSDFGHPKNWFRRIKHKLHRAFAPDTRFQQFMKIPKVYQVEFSKRQIEQYISDTDESFFKPTQRIKAAMDYLNRVRIDKSIGRSSNGNSRKTRSMRSTRRISLRRSSRRESPDRATRDRDVDHNSPMLQDEQLNTGFEKLVEMGVFDDAYALHDGPSEPTSVQARGDPAMWNTRALLGCSWASLSRCLKPQPLWMISEYFGKKIALYFTWLEFYTRHLAYASVFGVMVAIYGYIRYENDLPTTEICDPDGYGNVDMCPDCEPPYCTTYKLIDACQKAKHTHAFENDMVPLWGLLISCWAAIMHHCWERERARFNNTSDSSHSADEEKVARANYKHAAKDSTKRNNVTGQIEPFIPRGKKIKRRTVSACIIALCIAIMMSFQLVKLYLRGLVIRRFVQVRILGLNDDSIRMLASFIMSTVNLAVSLLFEAIYTKITLMLNEYDLYKTDEKFENNYIYKIVLFQYVNYLIPIYFIAFVKNNMISIPSDITGFSAEGCSLSSCEIEVVIQFGVILIGRQIYTSLSQVVKPYLQRKINEAELIKVIKGRKAVMATLHENLRKQRKDQVESDRVLAVPSSTSMPLVSEYLQMIIQYAFVVLSVPFPPAPLFSLITNVFEVRIDARKYTHDFRRPIPEKADNIGAWYNIMKWTTKLAIITNAFYISFSTEIIPRWYYYVHNNFSHEGYLNQTLAQFATTDYGSKFTETVKICYYTGYRHPAGHPNQYEVNSYFWQTVAAKIAFVLIFERMVYIVKDLFTLFVPDTPISVTSKIKHTNYLARRALHDYQLERKQKRRTQKRRRSLTLPDVDDVPQSQSTQLSSRSKISLSEISPKLEQFKHDLNDITKMVKH